MAEDKESPSVVEGLEPSPVRPEQVKELFSAYRTAQLSTNKLFNVIYRLMDAGRGDLSFDEEVEQDKMRGKLGDTVTESVTLASVLKTLGQEDQMKTIREEIQRLEPIKLPQK